MANIYIPNKGAGHDYSEAAQYGRLVYVTVGKINPFNTGSIMRHWLAALETSAPDDWIVMTSLNTICAIGAFLFGAAYGRLNLMIYTREGEYERRRIIAPKSIRQHPTEGV